VSFAGRLTPVAIFTSLKATLYVCALAVRFATKTLFTKVVVALGTVYTVLAVVIFWPLASALNVFAIFLL
jgi:hypothetical protein